MVEKCNKYEGLFVFGSEHDLQEHLKVCSDCQKEHEEMQKVSSLVKEVKPFIRKKSSRSKVKLKVAACFLTLIFGFGMINLLIPKDINKNKTSLATEISPVAQMGLPTDEYGLLYIQ